MKGEQCAERVGSVCSQCVRWEGSLFHFREAALDSNNMVLNTGLYSHELDDFVEAFDFSALQFSSFKQEDRVFLKGWRALKQNDNSTMLMPVPNA